MRHPRSEERQVVQQQVATVLALGLDHMEDGAVELCFNPAQLTNAGATVRVPFPLVVRGSVGLPRTTVRMASEAELP